MDLEKPIIEGIGNEVIVGFSLVIGIALPLLFFAIWWIWRYRWVVGIHPDSQELVDNTRQRLPEGRRSSLNAVHQLVPQQQRRNMIRFRRNTGDSQCPICLNDAKFGVETNCGHLFCGSCITTYWLHGNWLGAVRCPVCRQEVTVLLLYFTEVEQHVADPVEVETKNKIVDLINSYNRRFSGEPRPIMDYIRDLPTLLRHLWNEFFSVGGLMYMFRIRVLLCFLAACMYLISPLDVIPEALFGILGLCDDIFVVLLLAMYVSIIYRRFLAQRE